MAESIINPEPEPESGPEPFFNSNRSVYGFDVPSSGPSFPDGHTTPFELGFGVEEATDDHDSFFCGGGYDDDDDYVEESVNFVTDLFESRQPLVDADDANWEFDSDRMEDEMGVEYGFSGFRGVDIDSDSDSEGFEMNSGTLGRNNGNDDDTGDDYRDGAYIDDIFGINYLGNEDEAEGFEWEEVSERFNLDEREALNSVIEGIRDISISSDVISSSEDDIESELDEDEHVRNIEWEVLLAVNNIDRGFDIDFENPEDVDENVNVVNVNLLPEDYVLAMEYDALFGQLVENATSHKGSPPASKHAVESLQTVVLEKDDVTGVVTCAVCKDEVAVGEKLTKMPCSHLYHGDCIVPWLKIRNTCPVCRYELPTDDADYERRRASRVVRGGDGDRPGSASRAGDIL